MITISLQCNENELCIDVYYKQSLWRFSILLQLEPCSDKSKVICDVMAHW